MRRLRRQLGLVVDGVAGAQAHEGVWAGLNQGEVAGLGDRAGGDDGQEVESECATEVRKACSRTK